VNYAFCFFPPIQALLFFNFKYFEIDDESSFMTSLPSANAYSDLSNPISQQSFESILIEHIQVCFSLIHSYRNRPQNYF
jgi:hypothetical protein